MGIRREKWQGIHHRAGQGWRDPNFKPGVVHTPLGRDPQSHLRHFGLRTQHATSGLLLRRTMDQHGKRLLHTVRIDIRLGQHPHGGLSLAQHGDSPVDPLLPPGGNYDLADRLDGLVERLAHGFQRHLDLLRFRQVVADDRRQHHFILLHKESGGLQAHHQLLPRDQFRRPLANPGPPPKSPHADLPPGQVLWHRKLDPGRPVGVGRERCGPVGEVGKLLPDHGSRQRGGIGGSCHCHRRSCHTPGHRRAVGHHRGGCDPTHSSRRASRHFHHAMQRD